MVSNRQVLSQLQLSTSPLLLPPPRSPATVLDGMDQARAAGIKIKVNMVPLRGQNLTR